MSSAVVSTSAALGRPFLFDAESEAEVRPVPGAKKPASTESAIAQVVQSTINNQKSTILHVTPASRLEIRPAPEMVTCGIPALDALTGGLPRGCLTEICGPASSGRTTVLLAALASATRRGEYCAVIDASDALDPHSLAAAGTALDHLLWVRCGNDIQQNSRPIEPAGPPKEMQSAKETKSAGAPPLSRTLRQGGGFDFLSQGPLPLDFWQSEIEGSSPRCERNTEIRTTKIRKQGTPFLARLWREKRGFPTKPLLILIAPILASPNIVSIKSCAPPTCCSKAEASASSSSTSPTFRCRPPAASR